MERTEISNNLPFNLDLYSRPVTPVHWLYWFYIEVSTHLRTLQGRKLPLHSSATLHVVGPGCRLAPVVRVCFLGRPSQARRRRPPCPSRCGQSHRPVGPVLLETWCHGLPGPRPVQSLHPSDVPGSRARLSGARVGGGSFKFVVASRSESPRSHDNSPCLKNEPWRQFIILAFFSLKSVLYSHHNNFYFFL